MKKHPKLLRGLLTPTEEYRNIPTNKNLDNKIEILSYYLIHVWPLLLDIIKGKLIILVKYRWKSILFKLLLLGILLYSSYYAWLKVAEPIFIYKREAEFISKIHKDITKKLPEANIEFMNAISLLESSGNPKAINGSYIGLYQMGNAALKDVGLSDLSKEKFLNDVDIQNWAMNQYMIYNYRILEYYIIKYKIPYRGGIRIGHNLVTVSGLLAAAHLVGAGAVKRFIESNGKDVSSDGNGVPLTHYFQLNGYKLKLE